MRNALTKSLKVDFRCCSTVEVEAVGGTMDGANVCELTSSD